MGWTLEVSAGPHARALATVDAETTLADGGYVLRAGASTLPAQVEAGRLLAVIPHMDAGQKCTFQIEPDAAPANSASAERQGATVHVEADGGTIGDLRIEGATKPYLYPLLLPGGESVVRRVPADAGLGDKNDHPHHRGLWAGHGDCNGADCWSDLPGRMGSGLVREATCRSGPVAAGVHLQIEWQGPSGTTAFHEDRTYRFWAVGGTGRCIDVTSAYRGPDGGELRFGDTKEGALCCIRLASGLEGDRGGLITTAEGARTEAEAWGSAAGWCDCSGRPILADGKRGPEIGVAIFDHPGNPLHPTRWHVRDYGLMTANPFALHDYMPRSGRRGDHVVPAGQTEVFRYRVFAHRGGAAEAGVAGQYAEFAWPVVAKVLAD